MNKTDLIDFNNENCSKIMSPLIAAPKTVTRLSDVENNPFDKVLRIIANQDDPFECNTVAINDNFKSTVVNIENKENVEHLVSPIQTPTKSRKNKKLSTTSLLLYKNLSNNSEDVSNFLHTASEMCNLSVNCDITDSSLQILNDSFINNDDFSNSSNNANCTPLPNSPNSENQLNPAFLTNTFETCMNAQKLSSCTDVYESKTRKSISDFSDFDRSNNCGKFKMSENYNDDSIFLEANQLVEVFKKLDATFESSNNLNVETVPCTDISLCLPPWTEEEIVFVDCEEFAANEIKPLKTELDVKKEMKELKANLIQKEDLHNTFDKNIIHKTDSEESDDFKNQELTSKSQCDKKEINKEVISEVVKELPISDKENKKQSMELNISDNYENQELPSKSQHNKQTNKEFLSECIAQEELQDTVDKNKECNNTKSQDFEMKNAKDLLDNLTAIVNSKGAVTDQRKLGENLLNSLALALNIENPILNSSTENYKASNKLQRSKSDSKVSLKNKCTLINSENKLRASRVKTQSTATIKTEKNLKVKNEKEKVITKGPLKALIPLTNMAKSKKSTLQKVNLQNSTPPRQSVNSLHQTKKTGTPNDLKMKLPIAQSTPEVLKTSGVDTNSETPISKRHFSFSVSPLSRPASTNDISNTCVNKSLSPRSTSGSAPILSTSKHCNSSIPTIKSINRRNSTSDMSTSSTTTLNRSYENNGTVRSSLQLKRSFSFQNKSTSTISNSNNVLKKYGLPSTLKPLKLVSKSKKTTAD